jgi:hypothetical protein
MHVMATFHSPRYPSLVAHDGGRQTLQFHGGIFETDTPKQVELLRRVPGVVEIDPDEHPDLMRHHRYLAERALIRERGPARVG